MGSPVTFLAAEAGASSGGIDSGLLLIAGLGVAAFVVGRVTRRWLSEVVVFIAIGIVVGPEVTNLIDGETVKELDPVVSVALGAIVFGIGEHLEIPKLKKLWHTLAPIAALENALTFGLVFIGMLVVGVGFGPAFLLAAIALSTSPTTLVAVISERRAQGTFTDHVMATTALNNVASALLYGLGLPFVLAASGTGLQEGAVAFVQLVVLSIAIGVAGAFVLRQWADAIHGHGERLLFVLVTLLAIVATSRWLGAPVVVSTLIAGAVVANDPRDVQPLFRALKSLEAPIFLVFFVVAGAGVHFDELIEIGGLGAAYVAARLIGKMVGSWGGVELTRSGRRSGWGFNVGLGLTPFAGMAIGLAAFTLDKADEAGLSALGGQVTAIVLGSVVVFELLGPLSVRRALDATGDAGRGVSEKEAKAAEEMAAPYRIRHILFPVSSLDMARQKGSVVIDLAVSMNARLTALHIVADGEEPEPDVADPALSVVRQLAQQRGAAVELIVRSHRSVVDGIIEEANRAAVDLVVIGEPAPRQLVPNARRLVHDVLERIDPNVRVMVVPTLLDRRGRALPLPGDPPPKTRAEGSAVTAAATGGTAPA